MTNSNTGLAIEKNKAKLDWKMIIECFKRRNRLVYQLVLIEWKCSTAKIQTSVARKWIVNTFITKANNQHANSDSTALIPKWPSVNLRFEYQWYSALTAGFKYQTRHQAYQKRQLQSHQIQFQACFAQM